MIKTNAFVGCMALVAFIALLSTTGRASEPFRLDSDEFPIGMFSVDSAGAMAQVSKMGVGFVHTYGNGRGNSAKSITKDLKYLDLAHKHGMRVMFNLSGGGWVKKKDGVREMLKLVHAVKEHPALGFWYFYDEPDGHHTPKQVMPYYLAIKKATPDIPVAIAACWSEKWDIYNDVLDTLMIDVYPVAKRFPESDISMMTRFTDDAVALGKPVMPINQCINWRALARGKKILKGVPVAKLRYPNKAELRYWCYSGAAQGVRGMFWWSYYRSVQAGYTWINKDFAEVMREFREFTLLTAPTHKPQIFTRARDANMLMAMWRRPKGNFLVVANGWPLEQSVSRWTEDKIEKATLTPWGPTRKVNAKLEKGRLTVSKPAKPWEVFIWKMDP